jgi:hypothetical protein
VAHQILDERALACHGLDRADQHEDALGHQQRGNSLHNGVLLTTASFQLVVERRVNVGQSEAEARDLASEEAGRADVVAFRDEFLDGLAAFRVKLHGVDVRLLNTDQAGELRDRLALAAAGIEDVDGVELLRGVGSPAVQVLRQFGNRRWMSGVIAETFLGFESSHRFFPLGLIRVFGG